MDARRLCFSTILVLLVFIRHNTSSQPPQPIPPPSKPNCGCGSDLQQKIINSILGVPHNKNIPPPPGDVPLLVQVNLGVINIVSLDEQTHLWKTTVFLRTEWDDSRLQFANLLSGCPKFRYLQLTTDDMIDSFWKPNLYIPDEINGKVLDLPGTNRILRVFPNGHLFYSVQASVTLYCSGLGSARGEVLCTLQLNSYGTEADSIVLSWAVINNPVQINRTRIVLSDHVVGEVDTHATNMVMLTGNYSTLLANFHFQRKACLT